jgi:nitrogen fixation NifU-like protein
MSDLDDKLLEHFRNPRNIGVIDNPDGYARVENPVNGYVTDIYIRLINDQIKDIKFKTFGCTVTIASGSALTDIVKGAALEEIVDVGNPFENLLDLISKKLGSIPEKSWHCPPTAIQTLFTAIYEYYKSNKDEKNMIKLEKIIGKIQIYFQKMLD